MRILLFVCAILLLSLGFVSPALADNGPHGGYTDLTDKCAACHRAHTAKGTSLLIEAATATDKSGFCYSCHSGGLGAYTDVMNGLFLTTAIVPPGLEDTEIPVNNAPLAGGGFENVRMNPNFTSPMTLTVTSSHMITGGDNTVWGYGDVTSPTVNLGAANVALTCTNCHNPHGGAGTGNTPTYRLLKGGSTNNTPLFSNAPTPVTSSVDVPDEAPYARWYYIDEWRDTNYFGYHYYDGYQNGEWNNIGASLSSWCTQCHSRYLAPYSPTATLPSSTESGDAVFKYRHVTNRSDDLTCTSCHVESYWDPPVPSCVTCHVSHGTGATMGEYSGSVPWPGGGTAPSGDSRSSLLRLDSRGVCQQCHDK